MEISIDLNPPSLVEDPERFDRSGVLFRNGFFIFCHVRENEAKENARVPLNPARRRCDRSTRKLARFIAGSDSPRAYFRPHRRCSARDNGKEENLNHKGRFQAPFEGATRGLPLCGRSLTVVPIFLNMLWVSSFDKMIGEEKRYLLSFAIEPGNCMEAYW